MTLELVINNADGLLTAEANPFHAAGILTAGLKLFRIDHPLDPENKYLNHACVESSDVKTIYDGVIETDANGDATVQVPAYFEALNSEFRYQLTVIGEQASAVVHREITENSFEIETDLPNVKVSWQVTGIRKDPFVLDNPMHVEEEKPPELQGTYLHPSAYRPPNERGEAHRRNEVLKQVFSQSDSRGH